jgi:hypothetical protein
MMEIQISPVTHTGMDHGIQTPSVSSHAVHMTVSPSSWTHWIRSTCCEKKDKEGNMNPEAHAAIGEPAIDY